MATPHTVEYIYNTSTTEPPDVGEGRRNVATPSPTILWFHRLDATGADTKAVLLTLVPDSNISIRGKVDPTRWVTYTVAGAALDKGNYIEVPVTFVAEKGTLPNGSIMTVTGVVELPVTEELAQIISPHRDWFAMLVSPDGKPVPMPVAAWGLFKKSDGTWRVAGILPGGTQAVDAITTVPTSERATPPEGLVFADYSAFPRSFPRKF